MILSTMVLISSFNFQASVVKAVKENPKYVGKIVEICVDKECVIVDRTNDIVDRDAKEMKEETDKPQIGSTLTTVLDHLGGHGSVTVEYKETTKDGTGAEHTIEVKVVVEGGTGTGK